MLNAWEIPKPRPYVLLYAIILLNRLFYLFFCKVHTMPHSTNSVGEYFNHHWDEYKICADDNRFCHNEMFNALNGFLHENIRTHPFSFIDAGCGDCSYIAKVLQKNQIKNYIGIDIAEDFLKQASANMNPVHCQKQFIHGDMTRSLASLPSPVEVIFSSYAVHHLSYQQKFNFIKTCKNKLTPDGFFIMIDGVLDKHQTREQWLDAYEAHYIKNYPGVSPEALEGCMYHHRHYDYPERIKTFEKIAYELE